MKHIDLSKIRLFYVVAKEGNITKASQKLNISQPALSKSINDLENRIQAKLFYRLKHGVQLTLTGERLYVFAKQILELTQTFEESFYEKEDEIEGELKIITTPYVGNEWLIPNMRGFLKQYPKVVPTIMLSNEEICNVDNVDVAICGFIHNQVHLIQEQLFTIAVRLFASPDYLKEFGTPQKPEDLDNHKIIFNEEKYMPYGNWILNVGHSAEDIPRKPCIKIYSLPSMIKAATLGLGIVEAPDLSSIFKSGLKEILPHVAGPQVPYYFVFSESRKDSKKIKALQTYLSDKGK